MLCLGLYDFGVRNPVSACAIICGLIYLWPAALLHFIAYVTVIDGLYFAYRGFVWARNHSQMLATERRIQLERARQERLQQQRHEAEIERIRHQPAPPPPPPQLTYEQNLQALFAEHAKAIQAIEALDAEPHYKRALKLAQEDALAVKLQELGSR